MIETLLGAIVVGVILGAIALAILLDMMGG